MATAGGPIVVYGIPVENPELGNLVAKVIRASVLIALLNIGSVILNVSQGAYFGLIGLITLLIPFCGYMGAKDRSRDLLQWFKSCNCICAACGILSIALVFGFTIPACHRLDELSDDVIHVRCELDYTDLYIAMAITIISVLLQIYAFNAGSQLYDALIVSGVAYVAAGTQPGYAQAPAAGVPVAGAYQPPPGQGAPAAGGYQYAGPPQV